MLDLELLSMLAEILGVQLSDILEDRTQGAHGPRLRGVHPPDLKKTYDAACETLTRNPTNIQALFERGIVCRTIAWYPEALADFVKVIRLEPKNARAWLYYSEVLANLGEHDRSGKARKIALELDPDLK